MKSSNIIILSVKHYRFGLVFTVQGETGKYTVDWNIYKGWICDCPDHFYRHRFCKHMQACYDLVLEKFGVKLPTNLWCDNHKADMVFINAEREVVI